MPEIAWIPLVAYLIGSLPAGVWAARLRGAADPRSSGSGSSGATNVLRVHGLGHALVVLVVDGAKGALAVELARRLAREPSGWVVTVAGAAVVLGHLYPVLAGFRGGKGAATSAGAALVMHPVAAGLALVSFAAVLVVTRRMSPASLAGVAAFAPIAAVLAAPIATVAFGVAATLLVVLGHRDNLRRLAAGREPRLF